MSAPFSERSRQDAAGSAALDAAFLRRFGITRLGDVTGLDVIGVPVWFAARPNSRGLSVSQGKGLTIVQARVSAAMEAIEGAVAEDTQRHVREYGSVRALNLSGRRLLPLDGMARVDPLLLDADRERAWVAGYSVRRNEEVLAPYELIGLDYRADFPWDRQAFQMSSQGLAAGFDYDRAALHALLELVENDACFLVDALATRRLAIRPVGFAPGLDPSLDRLVTVLQKAGLSPRFFDLTSRNGVPVVMATLPRPVHGHDGPGERVVAGVACRLNGFDAAVAALLEAIQSRLTDISGARDDLTPDRYAGDRHVPQQPRAEELPLMMPGGVDLSAQEPAVPVWRRLAGYLFDHGVDDIFVFALDSGDPDIKVVRVLAKGLSVAGGAMNRFTAAALDRFLQ